MLETIDCWCYSCNFSSFSATLNSDVCNCSPRNLLKWINSKLSFGSKVTTVQFFFTYHWQMYDSKNLPASWTTVSWSNDLSQCGDCFIAAMRLLVSSGCGVRRSPASAASLSGYGLSLAGFGRFGAHLEALVSLMVAWDFHNRWLPYWLICWKARDFWAHEGSFRCCPSFQLRLGMFSSKRMHSCLSQYDALTCAS